MTCGRKAVGPFVVNEKTRGKLGQVAESGMYHLAVSDNVLEDSSGGGSWR